MTLHPRRTFLIGAGSALALAAACDNSTNSRGADLIDTQADSALNFLYSRYPETEELSDKAAGILVMPAVIGVKFFLGGEYGRGALRVGGATVDYYSLFSGSIGFNWGGQQFSHVLFFMTEEALQEFRSSPGWAAGADAEVLMIRDGGSLSATTTTAFSPVVGVIFAQAGIIAGASLKGTKYTRIIP